MPGAADFRKSRTRKRTRDGNRGGAAKSSICSEGHSREATVKYRSAACSAGGLGSEISKAGENPTETEGERRRAKRSRECDRQGFKEIKRSQRPILFDTSRALNVRVPARSCISISHT